MSLQNKYQDVLDLGMKLEIKDGDVKEEAGVLKIKGIAKTQHEKDMLWDAIKKAGGEAPADLEADITVEVTDYYAKHTVQSGESLSKIAKAYYGDPMKYKEIFEANKDILKSADLIYPDQELTIPNL